MIGWLLVPPLGSLLKLSEMEIYKSWSNSRFHTWRVQKCVKTVQNSPEMNNSRWVAVCTYFVFVLAPNIYGNTLTFVTQNIDLELSRWSETPYFKGLVDIHSLFVFFWPKNNQITLISFIDISNNIWSWIKTQIPTNIYSSRSVDFRGVY